MTNDFDFDLFKKTIVSELGLEQNDFTIILDKWGYDIAINYPYEDISSVAHLLSDHNQLKEYIFDTLDGYNTIYLKVPAVRSMKIAETFSPEVIQKNEDCILIGDKNSQTTFYIDVWREDGELAWDYNQYIFNILNYKDELLWHLQHNDDIWYAVDSIVCENF